MLLGVRLMALGDGEGMDDLVLHPLRAHGERAAELGDALGGYARPGELVLLELHHFLFDLHHDGDDLVVEAARGLGSLGLLLRGGGKGVLLLPGNAPHVVDVLGGGAHVVVVIRVPETVGDHGVHHLLVPHARAPTLGGQGIGSSGHVLRAAGHDHVRVPGEDGPCALNHALHARAAHHAHGVGGNGVRQPGLHAHLTGHILALGGGEDTAEHQLVHLLGLHVAPLEHVLEHGRAQVGGGNVLQRPAKGTHGGTAAVDYIDFAHDDDLHFFHKFCPSHPFRGQKRE